MKHGFRPRRTPTDPKASAPCEIVRRYFPSATDARVESIIWGLTGWPYWWHIPRDGKTAVECFTKNVHDASAKLRKGVSLRRQLDEAWDTTTIIEKRSPDSGMEATPC